MRAHIIGRLTGSQEQFSLGIGDIIGRSSQAALCIDDPRISEAHALLSLRGSALMLLALRGRFRFRGEIVSEIELRPGMDIELYKECWLHCEEVVMPESLLGLHVPGMAPVMLTHTSSLFLNLESGARTLQPGYASKADVVFWSLGDTWSHRVQGGQAEPLHAGDVIRVAGLEIQTHSVAVRDASTLPTKQTDRTSLRLEIAPKSVKVHASAHTKSIVITGIPGKILACVARSAHPQTWDEVAHQVWDSEACMPSALRRRFDVGLLRLREKLHQLELPADLMHMDGSGLISLRLEGDDTVTVAPELQAPQ